MLFFYFFFFLNGNAVVLSIIQVGFISLAWNWSGCAIKAVLLYIYEVLEL